MKKKVLFAGLILLAILLVFVIAVRQQEGGLAGFIGLEVEPPYEPNIVPADFRAGVSNRFFSIQPGQTLVYAGAVRRELTLPGDKKTVMGVETVVLYERVFRGTDLMKEAEHYLAQDSQNDVWCFGQDIRSIQGTTTDTTGSWTAGVDGAKPGIWMKNMPQVGESFPQEYYEDGAEDIAEILSTSETVETALGKFFGCIKVRDWSPLAPSASTIKYYCPKIAKVVREEGPGNVGTTDLLEIREPGQEAETNVDVELTPIEEDVAGDHRYREPLCPGPDCELDKNIPF